MTSAAVGEGTATTQQRTVRRNPRDVTSNRDRIVIAVTAAVLALVVLTMVAGLYISNFRPPRAHVLEVGSANYTAADVDLRLRYLALFEPGKLNAAQSAKPVEGTLDVIEREELLLQRAPATLGSDVSAPDVEAALRKELVPDTTTTNPDGTKTTPEPSSVDAAFAAALRQRLVDTEMGREGVERIQRAKLLEERLGVYLQKDLPKEVAQVDLVVARAADRARAEQIRSVAQRSKVEDYASVASTGSVQGGTKPVGGLSWTPLDSLDPVALAAVKDLAEGAISPVVENEGQFEVYMVIKREASRALDEGQRIARGARLVDEWLTAQRKEVTINRDLSESETEWITNRAIGRVNEVRSAAQ